MGNYTTTQEGTTQVVAIQMYFEYSKPLLADLLITFSDAEIPESPTWIILVLLVLVALLATMVYRKKQRNKTNSSCAN